MAQPANKTAKKATPLSKKAMPVLYDLLKKTAPNKENSFVLDGVNFILATWLFKQPQLLQYRQHRHAFMRELKRHSEIVFVEDDRGFVDGVAVDLDDEGDAATVRLLERARPSNDNCKIISWEKTKQHKMFFKISEVVRLRRLPPFVSVRKYVLHLKANPRFTVERDT
jgi:hypothetical protein